MIISLLNANYCAMYIQCVKDIYIPLTPKIKHALRVFFYTRFQFVFFIEAALNRCLLTSNLAHRKYKEKFNFQFFVSDFHSAKRGLICLLGVNEVMEIY